MIEAKHHKTIFISDVHLGTRGCQAEMLLDFLRHNDADKIYLVGDIFDGWRMKKAFYWPQTHNDIVQKLLRKARKGTEIIYIPGNHDEMLRGFLGTHFGGIEVRDRDIHISADGTKYLVIHGDQFDMVVMGAKWLAHAGDWAYDFLLWFNGWFNRVRRLWGGQYWSLSKWAKLRVKQAVNFIGDFEDALATEAKKSRVDGVICGHIHHAALHDLNGVRYVNTGDWVESCTAIFEDENGKLHLVDWADEMRLRNLRLLAASVPQPTDSKNEQTAA
jgi:UDP-2,3-diacylglucosamine pyrophosphatase LpxH